MAYVLRSPRIRRRAFVAAGVLAALLLAHFVVLMLWPRPPFIPHTPLQGLVIDGWMVVSGNWDPSTVLPCLLHGHGVNACFDY